MHDWNKMGSIVHKSIAMSIPQAQNLQVEYEQRYLYKCYDADMAGDLESSLSVIRALSRV